ncbi:MAG: hypothetical protein LAP85_26050 [Acidobacteriia bacterium]|nr:hypothetical protein [Terriglobia bacterium]
MIHALNLSAEIWFRYLASAALQSTLVASIVLGAVWAGRRWPPALRHALLMLAVLKFAFPPTLSLPTGIFSRFTPRTGVAAPLLAMAAEKRTTRNLRAGCPRSAANRPLNSRDDQARDMPAEA